MTSFEQLSLVSFLVLTLSACGARAGPATDGSPGPGPPARPVVRTDSALAAPRAGPACAPAAIGLVALSTCPDSAYVRIFDHGGDERAIRGGAEHSSCLSIARQLSILGRSAPEAFLLAFAMFSMTSTPTPSALAAPDGHGFTLALQRGFRRHDTSVKIGSFADLDSSVSTRLADVSLGADDLLLVGLWLAGERFVLSLRTPYLSPSAPTFASALAMMQASFIKDVTSQHKRWLALNSISQAREAISPSK